MKLQAANPTYPAFVPQEGRVIEFWSVIPRSSSVFQPTRLTADTICKMKSSANYC